MRINFTKIKHTGVSQYLLHEEWIMSLQTMLREFGGHNVGGIKSGVSVVNSATVSLAR